MQTESQIKYPRRVAIRWILRRVINFLLFCLCEVKIEGKENLPKSGPLMIVGNHFHFVDPVVMIGIMPDKLEFVGGTQLPNAPVIVRFIPSMYGLLPVRRGSVSRDTLRLAKQVLDQNGALAIFPEAGSWLNQLRPARPGAAFLASTAPAKLLPVALTGVEDIFPALKRFKRASVVVKIGEPFGPFYVSEKGERSRENLDRIGAEIMQEIANLLPDNKRGFLSSDPSIRELVASTRYPWELEQEK